MDKWTVVIASDIHGSTDALDRVISVAARLGAWRLVVSGDLCPDSQDIAVSLLNAPCGFVCLRGNCDNVWDYAGLGLPVPREAVLLTLPDGSRMGICHGHTIMDAADFPHALGSGDIFVQGHSHVPHLFRDRSGIIHLNAGSASRPRNEEGASCALVTESGADILRLADNRLLLHLDRI